MAIATTDADVVTGETLAQYQADKLGWTQESAEDAEIEEIDSALEGAIEVEKPEVETEVETEEGEKKPIKPKSKLEQRMSDLANARRAAEERADAAERRAQEAEAKLKPAEPEPKTEPIKPAEVPGKPKASDYTDAFEYAEALSDWKVKEAFAAKDRSDAAARAQQEREKVASTWAERQAQVTEEFPDYMEITGKLNVVVSDELRDAIIDSEVGPRILYHLAQNPAEAKALAAMKPGAALKAIGKLEAKYEPAAESAPKIPQKILPKPSKAPAPIKPLKGGEVSDTRVNSDGEYTGSYDQYVADRKAGKV
jgi:SpoU rRNA methylase family enzyme